MKTANQIREKLKYYRFKSKVQLDAEYAVDQLEKIYLESHGARTSVTVFLGAKVEPSLYNYLRWNGFIMKPINETGHYLISMD